MRKEKNPNRDVHKDKDIRMCKVPLKRYSLKVSLKRAIILVVVLLLVLEALVIDEILARIGNSRIATRTAAIIEYGAHHHTNGFTLPIIESTGFIRRSGILRTDRCWAYKLNLRERISLFNLIRRDDDIERCFVTFL